MRKTHKYSISCGPGASGITLVELMVAVVVASVFLSGVIAAFIQILKATDRAEANIEAVNDARSALELMAIDIKAARIDTTQKPQPFIGVNNHLTYGDGIDNDNDGRIDEEYINSIDDDGDWIYADDNHTMIGGMVERPTYVNRPDYGDFHVDEDFKFDQDRLTIGIFSDPFLPVQRSQTITYEIGSYEGESRVLLRRVVYFEDGTPQSQVVSPLAFNVLSLNFLYWDPNHDPPEWREDWDGPNAGLFPAPGIELPVAVFISITIYSGTEPLEHYQPGDPLETATLTTIVNIEQILHDPRYIAKLKEIYIKQGVNPPSR
ncbi:type II secretion system protein [Candidatus Sumerlaeota bacterium]|nr:type II secretion system protein [Candidatus Sumerlaeota bacterium]